MKAKKTLSERGAFIGGCLRRVAAGHLEDAFVLADYLDDHGLTHASPLRVLLKGFESRGRYWCNVDMEKPSLRKWARWELLAQECRRVRRFILGMFDVRRDKTPELVVLWKRNRHLFDVPELREEPR
jgi:hypothetical protein